MDSEMMPGASAAMLHVPQPPPFQNRENPHHHTKHPLGDVSGRVGSRGRGGRGRGRGRGYSKNPPTNSDSHVSASPQPPSSRLQRPKVAMMPRTLSEILAEPKIALMHRVVNLAGPDIAWQTLMETLTIEEHGGLVVNADACGRPAHMMAHPASATSATSPQPRRRTKGGVFLTLLKTHVSKETYKKIFEVEDTIKKKRKKHMKFVKHQKMESKINELPLQQLWIGGERKATRGEEEDGEIDKDTAMTEAET